MRIADADILIVPGLRNSGPDHWQRRWATRMANALVVEQSDWDHPKRLDWVSNIERAILMATRPVVLVGHSLGVSAIVHTARNLKDTKVRAAFLVSPPDHERPGASAETADFAGVPRDPLPFPSMLVVSTTDPVCSPERAADFAGAWGAELKLAGDSGHINAASGQGPWPDGMLMFATLMQRIKA